MHLAAEIQRQILPKGAPVVPGYQLTGWNRPARQVGGDYYDLFRRADGRRRPGAGRRLGQGDAGGADGVDPALGPAPAARPDRLRPGCSSSG